MRIAQVDVFGHELTYVHGTFGLSGGRAAAVESSTLVRITTDVGLEGWGEACPLAGTYLPSFAGGVRAALAVLAPAVLGADPRNLAAVNARLDAALLGQPAAKSPLDVACWDIFGRATATPLATLLGGRVSDPLPIYLAVPIGSAEATGARVAEAWAQGVRRFQLKVGGDPRADVASVRAALEVTGDDGVVVVDANGGWSLQDALIAVRLLESLPVYLEQPCRSLAECVHVRRATSLPLVLDELVTDATTLVAAVREAGAGTINLKVGKVGGLTRARLLRDLAQSLGVALTIEDTWGGDVATAAVSHLAAGTLPGSLFSVSFLNDAVAEHVAGFQPRAQGGHGSAPDAPGLGIEVDAAALGAPLMTFSAS
jgi:cis-L-3-hydroxyproline dehydratase